MDIVQIAVEAAHAVIALAKANAVATTDDAERHLSYAIQSGAAAFTGEISRRAHANESMLRVLKLVQWSGQPGGGICPLCGGHASDGHDINCGLAMAIALAEFTK